MAALATLLASAAIAGCSSDVGDSSTKPEGNDESVGKIGAELMLGSVQIDVVKWTLSYGTGAGCAPAPTYPPMGTFNVMGAGSSFTGLITGVGAGTCYDLTFTADSTDNTQHCVGHAMPSPFSVSANQTTLQTVHLNCNGPAATTGKILVNGSVNVCAYATDITASANSAQLNGTINLTGAATDPDSAPMPIAYSFAKSTMQPSGAGNGSVSNTGPNAVFTCLQPGPVAVTMSITDTDAQCPASTYEIILICTGADLCLNHGPCPAIDACHNAGTCDSATGNCVDGSVKPVNTPCADSDLCDGTEVCNAAGACVNGTAVACTTPGQCQTGPGTCAPATGMCTYAPAGAGTPCTGGTCNATGMCNNPCAGVDCGTSAFQCKTATCNPSTGMCEGPNKTDGTTCNDGTAGTVFDACVNGACVGNTSNCNPANACCSCESTTAGGCQSTSTLCDTIMGMTTASNASSDNGLAAIPAGKTYAAVCRELLACVHQTGCAGADGTHYSDCLCGIGVEQNGCLAGDFLPLTGPCRDLVAQGVNSVSLGNLSNRMADNSFPSGVVLNMQELCDQSSCSTQCLGGNK